MCCFWAIKSFYTSAEIIRYHHCKWGNTWLQGRQCVDQKRTHDDCFIILLGRLKQFYSSLWGKVNEMHKVNLSTQIQKGAGATAQFGALHFKTGMTTWSKLMGRIVKIDHSFGRHDLRGKSEQTWAYCLEKTDKNLWAAATSERGGNSLFFMLRGFKCWNCTKNP